MRFPRVRRRGFGELVSLRSALLVPLLVACGGGPVGGLPPRTSGSALPEPGVTRPAAPPAPARPPLVAPGADLLGHFVATTIGNCILIEEWLSFGPAGALTYTWINRDACDPSAHVVRASEGEARVAGGTVRLAWDDGEERVTWSFSHAIQDTGPAGTPSSTGAPHGARVLVPGALLRGDDGVYRGHHARDSDGAAPTHERVDVALGLEREPCTAEVEIRAASLERGARVAHEEHFTSSCTIRELVDGGREIRLEEVPRSWPGAPDAVRWILDRHVPRLLGEAPGHPDELLPWTLQPYLEVLGPPPGE